MKPKLMRTRVLGRLAERLQLLSTAPIDSGYGQEPTAVEKKRRARARRGVCTTGVFQLALQCGDNSAQKQCSGASSVAIAVLYSHACVLRPGRLQSNKNSGFTQVLKRMANI